MNTRDLQLLEMRPEISAAKVSGNMSFDEQFQNQTLRPVVKLQEELLLEVFRNYVAKHKNSFYDLSLEKRLEYIDNAVTRDIKFRNSLKGIIIGQFTLDEYRRYILNSSALNKRMMNIVKQNLQAHLQLLERKVA